MNPLLTLTNVSHESILGAHSGRRCGCVHCRPTFERVSKHQTRRSMDPRVENYGIRQKGFICKEKKPGEKEVMGVVVIKVVKAVVVKREKVEVVVVVVVVVIVVVVVVVVEVVTVVAVAK